MKSKPIRKFSLNTVQQRNNNNNNATQSIKKSLPGPTSPLNFFLMAIYKYAKIPLLINMNYRIGFYFCLVSLGSVYFDIFKMPKSYFSNKYNILNQLFVKWAWGWTLIILFCFIVTTSYISSGGNKAKIKQNALRLLFGTVCWYICTGMFHMIENYTGDCYIKEGGKFVIDKQFKHRRICHRNNGRFVGFDISGHVFLLTLCNLWMSEEARILIIWRRLENFLLSNQCSDVNRLTKMSQSEFTAAKSAMKKLNMNIKFLTIGMSLLSILWDLMMIMTVVYFHNMPSKFMALIASSGCWYLSYRVIFPMKCSFLPHLPTSNIEELLGLSGVYN